MSAAGSPGREKSAPQPEEPVKSIEEESTITDEQWLGIWDMLMAIYDFREPDGHDPSRLFHRSVNKRIVPDYYDIIKEPMALSIVKARLNKREYKNVTNCVRDFALIPHNAQTYNRPKSQAYEDALVIKDVIITELKKLVERGLLTAQEAELPDLGEIPEADPLPEEDDEDEDDDEDDEDDSDDDRRKKKPGPKPGFKRGNQKNEPDSRKKRGRPPRVDTPMETRIKTILKGIRKFKGPDGQLKISHFERLPDKMSYPDYYMEIKEPIAIDIIKRKAKRKKYNSVDHFMRDLDLMFNNARAYNQSESRIYKDAVDLQVEARKLAEQEKKKPDSEYLMEDGRFPLPDGILHRNELWKVGDWVHIQNPNDVSKPIVAQIYRTWQDSDDQKWINACWYYRPEQTVHHFEKHFYPNEVVKTGQYRDHRVEEIVDRCFVMFFTRYSRGRPRDLPPDKQIYVCEARYNEEKHKLNKIKTWASCLPDEVREKDYEMDLFDVPRKIRKVPSPIKHLLKSDAKETDDLPRPTWGAENAPPMVGAVHRRPRDENVRFLFVYDLLTMLPTPSPPPQPPVLPPTAMPVPNPRPPMSQQPMATPNMAPQGMGAAPEMTSSAPAIPAAQSSPMPPAQPAYQTHMTPQMYQGPNQRRPSNFVPQSPAVAAAGYQASPATSQYAVQQQAHFGGNFPANRAQPTPAPSVAPPPVQAFNPNAPRPVEVYQLNEAANNAIPPEIRNQFHTDEQGHVLFFSSAPLDPVPAAPTKLSHSLKYLATKEERREKVAEYKRKFLEQQAQKEETAKRQRLTKEDMDSLVDEFMPKALEQLIEQMEAGTKEIYRDVYGENAEQMRAIRMKKLELEREADRERRKENEKINAQIKAKQEVSLRKKPLYMDF
ncbi:hypothetical protein N7539_009079 [Penicillium diatomitis]|uniref:Uncharacterized protein n=1 Tax=Penicillium diatomitis TaxID=2819901 RepID=A0A9X0BJD0_9EURO|nr:uncharacterized protein N7539_009079 [Penicillium diatomitis]KAJ5469461.1 hypothetical protein N7539_009079 [Penicillium diatomitis]